MHHPGFAVQVRQHGPPGIRIEHLPVKSRLRPALEADLDLIQKIPALGNPFGHAKMGLMYERGYEVGQDTAKAFEYYTTAANLKSRFGMFRLGHMYEKGKGVSKRRLLCFPLP